MKTMQRHLILLATMMCFSLLIDMIVVLLYVLVLNQWSSCQMILHTHMTHDTHTQRGLTEGIEFDQIIRVYSAGFPVFLILTVKLSAPLLFVCGIVRWLEAFILLLIFITTICFMEFALANLFVWKQQARRKLLMSFF